MDTLDYLLRDWTGRLLLTVFLLGFIGSSVVGWQVQQPLAGVLVGVVVGVLGAIAAVIGLSAPVDGFGSYALSVLTVGWLYLVLGLLLLGRFLLAAGVCIVPTAVFWLLIAVSGGKERQTPE